MADVEAVTPEIEALVDEMIAAMYAERGIGLAAPQIGVGLRIFVMDLSSGRDASALTVCINPTWGERDGMQLEEEGCLSLPGFVATVARPARAVVHALDRRGQAVTIDGTGLLARQALSLLGPGGRLTGVDPSAGMMAQARLPGVALLQGRAEALPLVDADVDFVSLGYALRHLSDLRAAFAEFARVLRPGGRVLLLEITKPPGRLARGLLRGYMRVVVPLAARWVTGRADTATLWRYYWDTIEACIAPEQVMDALRDAGFHDVQRHVELGIFSEYTARKAAS